MKTKKRKLSKEVVLRWSYCREKKCEFFKKSGDGCRSCAAEGGWSKSPSGALKLWNMRQQHKPRVTREWIEIKTNEMEQMMMQKSRRKDREYFIKKLYEDKNIKVEEKRRNHE